MSKTSISIVAYSVYLGSLGIGLVFIPNLLLGLLHQPTTQEVWIRVVGLFACLLSVKGWYGAILNLMPMMQLDVYTRLTAATFMTTLVGLGMARPTLLILALIDLSASVWTQATILEAKRKNS